MAKKAVEKVEVEGAGEVKRTRSLGVLRWYGVISDPEKPGKAYPIAEQPEHEDTVSAKRWLLGMLERGAFPTAPGDSGPDSFLLVREVERVTVKVVETRSISLVGA